MPDDEDLHQPHDKLFAATFGVAENTAAFLEAKLPAAVVKLVDWTGLRTIPGSFVDSRFQRSHTDLLFSAPVAGKEGLIYVLFEHQSTPDRWLPLRLLRYLVRIWESIVEKEGAGARLPVILPVVLAQNGEMWDLNPRFAALLDVPDEGGEALLPYIPVFRFEALQLAEMEFGAIPGTPPGILVLRVMKASRLGRLLDAAVWDEALMERVPEEILHLVWRYILGADIDKKGFERRIMELENARTRSLAMTLAERYHQEGRQEGRQEGILEALAIRFGAVPEGLAESVRGIVDEERLSALHRNAITCASLEGFAADL